MKLNHECVRDLMLAIESVEIVEPFLLTYFYEDQESLKIYTLDELFYTTLVLEGAGFLNAEDRSHGSGPEAIIRTITWEGHQFLDNIRDDGVWKDTKAVVSKLSSVSLGVVSDVASKIIAELIKRN